MKPKSYVRKGDVGVIPSERVLTDVEVKCFRWWLGYEVSPGIDIVLYMHLQNG